MEAYNFVENLEGLLAEIPGESIVSRSVLKNERVDVTLFGFAAGQELTEHTSSKPAILHFLKGKARVTLGEDEKRVEGEAWVYMPPSLSHSISAETAVVMLLILLK